MGYLGNEDIACKSRLQEQKERFSKKAGASAASTATRSLEDATAGVNTEEEPPLASPAACRVGRLAGTEHQSS
jgi:hypothetical protein